MEHQKRLSRLEEEWMLQINERLFRNGILPQEVYEAAKLQIVNRSAKHRRA